MNSSMIMEFLETALTVLGIAYVYMSVFAIIGFFSTRHFPEAKHNHRYAIIIAARNEENVLGQLLLSIRNQTYPSELLTTFVVADNCTDQTADIARACGAVCYEHNDPDQRTKGYALRYLFQQIRADYGVSAFEGYMIFDADNILKPDYVEKMNRAFDAGEKVITSYRNTKNWGRSCIAASYALHWMRTARCENRAKSILHMACRIQGTGYLFASELVADGWDFVDLTEDRAFCADAVRRGYQISYQDEAEFYDEQPESLTVAVRQRMRWSKGHLQAFQSLGGGLLKRCFTVGFHDAATAWDMFLITLPSSLIQSGIKLLQLLICAAVICFHGGSPNMLTAWIQGLLLALWGECAGNVVTAAYTMLMERKHLPQLAWYKKVWYCLTFPMFSIIGTITYCLAAVSRVEWKPIPHHASANIELSKRPRTVYPRKKPQAAMGRGMSATRS